MQRNNPDSKSIKEEIDRHAENYLKEVEKANKKDLEALKNNPNQNISNTHSFVGASFTLFPDAKSFIAFLAEQKTNEPDSLSQNSGNAPKPGKNNS